MSLHGDLLEQAAHLARREPKRPRQASLRRAVSAAYYALFHLLCDEASRRMIGHGIGETALRQTVRRAFAHGDMKAVARSFSGGAVPAIWQGSVGGPVQPDLRQVADVFVELQQSRHDADYDLSSVFRRAEVIDLIQRCEAAFSAWSRCRNTAGAQVFLVALLINKQLKAH